MAQLSEQISFDDKIVEDDTRIVVNVWKVAPGEHARVWEECRESGCITINWLRHRNFNDFADKAAIRRELSKSKHGRGGAPFIWRFVKEIQIGDIVVANNGLSRVEGIGVVTSEYLPPDDSRNPRKNMDEHPHARLVKWLIDKPVELHRQLFSQPTVETLDSEQCRIIKRAYLKQYSKWKETLDRLLPDDSQCDQAEDINEILNSKKITSTTKKALIDARLGQGKFRKSLLRRWGQRCSVTSSAIVKAIRASHIKPWREATNDERLDTENGLPLIASLDALFDVGLISFEASGQMIVSSELNAEERQLFGIGDSSLTKTPTAKMAAYLAHHRNKYGFKQ